ELWLYADEIDEAFEFARAFGEGLEADQERFGGVSFEKVRSGGVESVPAGKLGADPLRVVDVVEHAPAVARNQVEAVDRRDRIADEDDHLVLALDGRGVLAEVAGVE